MSAAAKETHVRALHLIMVSIVDNLLGKSSTDLAVSSRLKDSFQSSVNHASLGQATQEIQGALTVDLTSPNGSEGARNIQKIERGNAP
jgi:subtilisin-like proprotein convertase family protein